MTPAGRKVYDTVIDFKEENGYPPSIRDIAKILNRSHTAVWLHLKKLREDGDIEWIPGASRTISIVERKEDLW